MNFGGKIGEEKGFRGAESRMQGRHRNSNDGRGYNNSNYPRDGRGYNSNYRNFNRNGSGSFGRSSSSNNNKPYLPPPQRTKQEILREAGRLAAEYLVSQGLLPAEVLPLKGQNGRYQEFKGQDREAPVPDGRTSALNRLGSMNSDVGNGRRRHNDEYNDGMGSRNQFRGKKRMGPYGREYGSDWGRENGRWMGRNRGYNDMEDDDDFAPGYNRDRRGGFEQLPSRSVNTGESGSENHDIAEDTGSKASSSSTRRDLLSEVDGELSKAVVDDSKAMNLESGEEVKSDASGDFKKKNVGEELEVQPAETEGDSKSGDDLMKLCSYTKVPTKPRSLSQRSPKKDQCLTTDVSDPVEDSSGEPKVTSGEDIAEDSLNNSPANQTETKGEAPEILSNSSVQTVVESVDQQQDGSQDPPGFGSSKTTVDEAEETNKKEGMKRQRESSPEDESSRMQIVRVKRSSPEVENRPVDDENVTLVTDVRGLPMDEDVVAPVAVDQEKPLGDAFIQKAETELDDDLEAEKQLLSPSFKICDLNLMQGPEITEIADDPDTEHLHPSAPTLETGKELSMDFSLSIGNNNNGADDFSRLQGDDKVVHVIDLEDDSTVDARVSDPSKPKDEPIYPNLDSFLNQPEHADLPGIQDGYSLAMSEFYGSDISRCPSVPSDLNNLQTEMSLHDAQGVPNDDDSIYVSLGEIPIGFMEVWDQPSQEYGKFF